MKERDFVKKIIELYRSARISKFPDPKIRRGRSHSISSFAEDLFAKYLIGKIKADFIYVDQPISIRGSKAQSYPDIVVVKNSKLIAFCDLKTDLGFNRDGLFALCKKHNFWLKRVAGKNCKIRDGVTKKDYIFKINKSASYNIVLISGRNINKEKLYNQIQKSKKFSPKIDIFILTEGKNDKNRKQYKVHLNDYGKSLRELLDRVKSRDDFSRLVKKLK